MIICVLLSSLSQGFVWAAPCTRMNCYGRSNCTFTSLSLLQHLLFAFILFISSVLLYTFMVGPMCDVPLNLNILTLLTDNAPALMVHCVIIKKSYPQVAYLLLTFLMTDKPVALMIVSERVDWFGLVCVV